MKNRILAVENKIQFSIVLGMFLPVLLEALFNFSGANPNETSGVVMKYGLIVFLLIMNYLFFEWKKYELTPRQLDYINWVFVIMIMCFAVVIMFFALLANGNVETLNWISLLSFPSALTGIMYIPLVSIGVIMTTFFQSK